MLIIDSGHVLVDGKTVKIDWNGTLAFFYLPDSGKTLEPMGPPTGQGPFEFFFTTKPDSHLSCLRDIIAASARNASVRKMTSLLFVSRSASADLTRRLASAVSSNPDLLEYELDDTGEMSALACGENVVKNSDFFRFFNNMIPGLDKQHTAGSLELMNKYLGAGANA